MLLVWLGFFYYINLYGNTVGDGNSDNSISKFVFQSFDSELSLSNAFDNDMSVSKFIFPNFDNEIPLSIIIFPSLDNEFSLSKFVLIFWESQYVSPNVPHIMHEPAYFGDRGEVHFEMSWGEVVHEPT